MADEIELLEDGTKNFNRYLKRFSELEKQDKQSLQGRSEIILDFLRALSFKPHTEEYLNIFNTSDKIIRNILNEILNASVTNESILLLGETGTGKELFAQFIHFASPRREKPFIAINLAGYPDTLIESELFGHEKGAFTGAYKVKKGILETAEGGTVFLDEIGDVSLAIQTKILRTLQEKKYKRLGGITEKKFDVRFIFGTNKNLTEQIKNGNTRLDFYYRINTFEFHIPSLKDRATYDKISIAKKYLNELNIKYGDQKIFHESAINFILRFNWPGNVRELKNTIFRAYNKSILKGLKYITESIILECINKELGEYYSKQKSDVLKEDIKTKKNDYEVKFNISYFNGFNLRKLLRTIEEDYIKDAYKKCKTEKEMGKLLGYSQQSIHNKIKKYISKEKN